MRVNQGANASAINMSLSNAQNLICEACLLDPQARARTHTHTHISPTSVSECSTTWSAWSSVQVLFSDFVTAANSSESTVQAFLHTPSSCVRLRKHWTDVSRPHDHRQGTKKQHCCPYPGMVCTTLLISSQTTLSLSQCRDLSGTTL